MAARKRKTTTKKYQVQYFHWIVAAAAIFIGGFFLLNSHIYKEKQGEIARDHKNAQYVIGGQVIKLTDGVSDIEAAPGSASHIVTRYFGNDFPIDLNGDGREDVVFMLTQQAGGSGTFYYVVAALNTEAGGYIGSESFLLGDRIAPQSIELSQNPRHRDVIVVNYADRAAGEPMTAQPSVGKSVYLKLDPTTMQFGYVMPDFEGESR
ncbi:hypothetical protein C4568_01595 [Candidatus Parcubacteria bacterium]|nr:MAG: hypothetical protein C4568_01595 [Candidatus Parcubacteria bacterium]